MSVLVLPTRATMVAFVERQPAIWDELRADLRRRGWSRRDVAHLLAGVEHATRRASKAIDRELPDGVVYERTRVLADIGRETMRAVAALSDITPGEVGGLRGLTG